jgi:peptidoglycan/LPS O-acetylase OafA/YrhL
MVFSLNEVQKPHSSEARQLSQLPALNGLRGFAAILVFWYHARWRAGDPEMMLGAIDIRSLFLAMDGGVGIFFVLSGFLLSRPFWKSCLDPSAQTIALIPYLIRRALRIVPAYYLSLIHTHIFSNLTYTFWGAFSFLLSLLGLHTFFHQSYVWDLNPVIWSISIEIQFYLLLPILFSCAGMITRMLLGQGYATNQNKGLIILCMITVLCFGLDPLYRQIVLALAPHLPPVMLGGQDAASSAVVNNSVFYYLKWFWTGIGSAWLYQEYARGLTWDLVQCRKYRLTIADLLVVVSILGTLWILLNASEGEWRSISLYGFPANCLFFSCLIMSAPHSALGRWLFDNTMLKYVGEVSYGVYLWHWFVQIAVFKGSLSAYFKGSQLLWTGGLVSFLVTVGLASLSYFLLERPAIALGHQCRSFSALRTSLRSMFRLS